VKPLTAAEVRAAVSRLPAEYRDSALNLLASAWDEGVSAGLARSPRSANPFLPSAAAPEKTKGKAR
jgi:hypothetical protein